jgi:mRNA interferase RelE/StbE
MFEIFVSNKAKKFLRSLDRKVANEITIALSFLKVNPVPVKEYDVKKLSRETDFYRIRIGRYRVVYNVYWNEKKIRIAKIEMRDETTYKRWSL